MLKMGNARYAISNTRSETWTTPICHIKGGEEEMFCIENCPHPNSPCKGDCPEMKEWRKAHRSSKKRHIF